MAYLHEHHETHEPAIVEERDGVSAAVIAIGVILVVALLVWLFAFSGVVFDNNDGNTNNPVAPTQVENNTQNNTTDSGGDGGSTDTTDTTNTQPSTATS